MPTGYTSKIKETTTLKEFALICAREIDYLYLMHDWPSNAEIPEEFKPSTYHLTQIKTIKNLINNINNLSEAECEIKAEKEYKEEINIIEISIKDNKKEIKNYERILNLVLKWKSPTPKHNGLYKFMIEQLQSSIKHDNMSEHLLSIKNNLVKKSGKLWRITELEKLSRELKYHQVENKKEIHKTKETNLWLKQLREGLE